MKTPRRFAAAATTLIVSLTTLISASTEPTKAEASSPAPSTCFRGETELTSCALAGNPVGKATTKKAWLTSAEQALAPVPAFLRERKQSQADGERLAVVAGVDDVALGHHFGRHKPVAPTRKVLRQAWRLGYAVFFVTGQKDENRPYLRRQLTKSGFEFNSICTKSPGETSRQSKKQCRRSITERGYTIVTNISASTVSFKDGYFERGYSMPNYQGWWR